MMHSYSSTDLHSNHVQEQAAEAFDTGCIDNATYQAITDAYPFRLYTPNLFIRIALGLLTAVAVLFSAVLIGLLFGSLTSGRFTALFIIVAIACYSALEILVKHKRYYNAGVDNVLMVATLTFSIGACLSETFSNDFTWISGLSGLLCIWLSIRFTDALMAVLAYLFLYAWLFLLYIKFGAFAKTSAPFVMATVAALIYFAMKKWRGHSRFFFYQFPLTAVTAFTLLTFYASLNYFVVRELSDALFHLQPSHTNDIPGATFFWISTVLIPLLYIAYGIRKKDLLFIRTGLLLTGAAILTVRYYHPLLPLEWALLIAGVILVIVSYALIQYLKQPRYGFIFEEVQNTNPDTQNAEAVITGQTFSKKAVVESGFQFGGGSGGGGGATGNF